MINRPLLLARIGTLLAQSVELARVRVQGAADYSKQSATRWPGQFRFDGAVVLVVASQPIYSCIVYYDISSNMQQAANASVQVRTRFYCLSIYTFRF